MKKTRRALCNKLISFLFCGILSWPRKRERSKRNVNVIQREEEKLEHQRWLSIAEETALASPDQGGSPHPTVKVGAVLVGTDGKEIARGANRFARGVDRLKPERYADGYRSLWINCAEQVVLMEAARNKAELKGARLYVTLDPCAICAGLVVEAGIAEVVLPSQAQDAHAKLKGKWKNSIEVGLEKLAEAGVKVTRVDYVNSGVYQR